MKKKLFVIGLTIMTLLWVALIILFVVKSHVGLTVICLTITLLLLVGFYGLFKYDRFIGSRIIDPKRELKRNYDRLVVGSMCSNVSPDGNTLDLRCSSRNFHVHTLMVERYYGFVRNGGTVEIYIENNPVYYYSKKISVLDYPLLHQVTLLENGIDSNKYKYLQYNIIVGFIYLLSCLRIKKMNTACTSKTDLVKYLSSFCLERGLRLLIIDSDRELDN